MTDQLTRVVLADDSLVIRQGVAAMVAALGDAEVVAECSTLGELDAAVAEHVPDLVITDIRMPPTHTDEGIGAAIRFRAQWPQMGVLVLSQYSEPDYVLALFEEGSEGLGYLLKDRLGDLGEFRRAVSSVLRGESAIDPAIVEVLVQARTGAKSAIDRLTPREAEVLALIAEGLNNSSIAERLVVSEKAVAKHINSIFSKLGVGEEPEMHRRVRAVLVWLTASSTT